MMSIIGAAPEAGASIVPCSGPKGPGASSVVSIGSDGVAAKAAMISVTAMSKAIAPLWKPAERERAPAANPIHGLVGIMSRKVHRGGRPAGRGPD